MCTAIEDDEYESIPNSTVKTQMLAGALAGITEHVVTYPLDVVKTRMQIAHSGPAFSLFQSMNSVYIKEGLRAFTRGIKPVVLSAGPAHALYFAAYEQCKVGIKPVIKNDHISHALSGAVATLFHDGFVTPFDGKAMHILIFLV
jgi:solute carrier family 25 (mitochondrial iron transporter), member 28/37